MSMLKIIATLHAQLTAKGCTGIAINDEQARVLLTAAGYEPDAVPPYHDISALREAHDMLDHWEVSLGIDVKEARAALPPASCAQVLEQYPGFSEHTTGGGCMVMNHRLPDGSYIWITDTDGCNIPTDDDTHVNAGHFDSEGNALTHGDERADLGGVFEFTLAELRDWLALRLKP